MGALSPGRATERLFAAAGMGLGVSAKDKEAARVRSNAYYGVAGNPDAGDYDRMMRRIGKRKRIANAVVHGPAAISLAPAAGNHMVASGAVKRLLGG